MKWGVSLLLPKSFTSKLNITLCLILDSFSLPSEFTVVLADQIFYYNYSFLKYL